MPGPVYLAWLCGKPEVQSGAPFAVAAANRKTMSGAARVFVHVCPLLIAC